MKKTSYKLFFYKYFHSGNVPNYDCELVVGTILGIVLFLISPLFGILTLFTKKYEHPIKSFFINLGMMLLYLGSVTIFAQIFLGGIENTDSSDWWMWIVSPIFVIIIGVVAALIVIGTITLIEDNPIYISNPFKSKEEKFKEKHCKRLEYE